MRMLPAFPVAPAFAAVQGSLLPEWPTAVGDALDAKRPNNGEIMALSPQ